MTERLGFASVLNKRAQDALIATHQHKNVTHSEWLGAIQATAERLESEPATNWALFSDDALSFSIALFALITAGKTVYLPGNNTEKTYEQLSDHCDGFVGDWHDIPAIKVQMTQAASNITLSAPSSAEIVVFTSGSTGEPKAIKKALWQFEEEIATLEATLSAHFTALPVNAQIISTVSHQHIYGLIFRVLMPLLTGRPFYSEQLLDAAQVIRETQASTAPVLWIASPAHLKRLPDNLGLENLQGKLTDIFSSGGPFSEDAAKALHEKFGQSALEIFGSSETGGVAMRRQYADATANRWRPLNNVDIQAGDNDRLLIHSGHLSERPYAMDDKVALDDSGRFTLLGRLDRIVKLEEKRLSLVELETSLNQHIWISESACRVLKSAHRDQLCTVLVLSEEGIQALETLEKRQWVQAVKEHLLKRFELSLLPRKWRFVSALPVNTQSKIDAQQFEQLFSES